MDGEAWWAAAHGVTKSRTQLSDSTFTFHVHALEKKMATHSSVLAWRIPGTGEPGGLPSVGSHRVGHDWSDLAAAAVRPLKTYSLSKLQVCNTRMWTLVTRVYIRSPDLIHLQLKVCTLWPLSPHFPLPTSSPQQPPFYSLVLWVQHRDPICNWNHIVSVFLCLADFTQS